MLLKQSPQVPRVFAHPPPTIHVVYSPPKWFDLFWPHCTMESHRRGNCSHLPRYDASFKLDEDVLVRAYEQHVATHSIWLSYLDCSAQDPLPPAPDFRWQFCAAPPLSPWVGENGRPWRVAFCREQQYAKRLEERRSCRLLDNSAF